MKKITSVIMGLTAAAMLFMGCNSDEGKIKIGIIQQGQHSALDANYQGFVDGLAEAGYVDGKNIKIDYQNAQGEAANMSQIADKFVNNKVDLIFSIATSATQAVANKTQEIPIVASSVTDFTGADLVNSDEAPGRNVTGTSDLASISDQIDLISKIVPDVKTIGLLYSSDEPNSVTQIEMAKKYITSKGLKFYDAAISNTNEVQQVTENMAKKCQAIYIPTDNKLAASMSTVAMIANQNKLPTVVGESNMVVAGGLCTIGIDYYELGKMTAAMAVEILRDGKNPAEMPVQHMTKFALTKNAETEAALGLTLPDSL